MDFASETKSGKVGSITIRRAVWEEIVDLRHLVLRGGLPKEEAIFPGDEFPTSRHYAAFIPQTSGHRTVGCATLHLSKWEGEAAYQLRGMATAPEARRMGLGRALLRLAEQEILADASLPRLLWCNARVPALAFYREMGWTVVSEQFEIPTAGPHVRMVRRLEPPSAEVKT